MTTMTMTRQELETIAAAPAVLVALPSGPEWVTDYILYQDRGEVFAYRPDGTFDEVLCGPELLQRLTGDGPWTIGVAMSGKDVVDLWNVDVDAIVFRGIILCPREFL